MFRQPVAALAAFAAFLFAVAASAAPPTATDALKDRILGDPDAPVTIVEYSSLTCPHCAQFHTDTLPKLKEKYIDSGKVKLIYRDFPFDRNGLAAAVMARCANPDRYFQFLDVLFKNQESWTADKEPLAALAKIGRLGGLGPNDFEACMNDQELVDGLLKVRLHAHEQLGVKSTPTFIIDGEERIVGSQPFAVFDELLAKLVK